MTKKLTDIYVPLNVIDLAMISMGLGLVTRIEPEAEELCRPIVDKLDKHAALTRLSAEEEMLLAEAARALDSMDIQIIARPREGGGPWMN